MLFRVPDHSEMHFFLWDVDCCNCLYLLAKRRKAFRIGMCWEALSPADPLTKLEREAASRL